MNLIKGKDTNNQVENSEDKLGNKNRMIGSPSKVHPHNQIPVKSLAPENISHTGLQILRKLARYMPKK